MNVDLPDSPEPATKQDELLEDLGDVDIALGPPLEEKTCDRFRLKTIIISTETGHSGLSVVLVRCLHLQDLLVLQGTTKSTRKKSQQFKTNSFIHSNYFTRKLFFSEAYFLFCSRQASTY